MQQLFLDSIKNVQKANFKMKLYALGYCAFNAILIVPCSLFVLFVKMTVLKCSMHRQKRQRTNKLFGCIDCKNKVQFVMFCVISLFKCRTEAQNLSKCENAIQLHIYTVQRTLLPQFEKLRSTRSFELVNP